MHIISELSVAHMQVICSTATCQYRSPAQSIEIAPKCCRSSRERVLSEINHNKVLLAKQICHHLPIGVWVSCS